ncbi:MAG TPA: hypothetical protein VL337_08390 [Acidimicrobiales bacterium]|nr:hypothetical protein [Acidimicrobiales bacterium]
MANSESAPESERAVVYEVRALTNRWVEPQKGDVISTHASAKAAWAAFKNEPQSAADGSGRTSTGNYVAKAVVRVDADGSESMVLPPPAGGGLLSWPYN